MEFPRSHGPWQITARHEVYRDPWIEVDRDEVIRPDGAPGTHAVVRLKPGVSVLPVDDSGTVYLTEEFHYAVGRTTLEAVSGGIEADEDPLVAARRELEEELGIRPSNGSTWASAIRSPRSSSRPRGCFWPARSVSARPGPRGPSGFAAKACLWPKRCRW